MSAIDRKMVLTVISVLAVSLFIPSCVPVDGGIATATLDNGSINSPAIFATATETFTPLPSAPLPPTETYTATPVATRILMPTSTPTPTEVYNCVLPALVETYHMTDAGMTCEQLKVIREENYRLIYSQPGEQPENMYSLGRVETTSAFGITWKFVSGFVVDTAAPNEDDQLPSGDYVYFKVRFLDRQGIGHDYWLQIDALGPNKTISIVITDDLVSDPNDLIAAENIPYPADSFISDGMIRVGDQWIAQIPVEDGKGRGALRGMEVPEYKQILSEIMNALEGNGEFPANIPGFFVPAESLIVRK